MADKTGSVDLDHGIASLYGDNLKRTEFTLKFYKEFYALRRIVAEPDSVTHEQFAYCRKRRFFVNVLACRDGRIFMKRAIGARLGWELPGGSVRSRGQEVFQDAVARVLDRDIPGVEVAELRPVAYLEKRYVCGSESITHEGLTFMGRVRKPSRDASDYHENEDMKGCFIPPTSKVDQNRMCGLDRTVFQLGAGLLGPAVHETDAHTAAIEKEITSTSAISSVARLIHRYFVHPVGAFFSSRRLKAEIRKYLRPEHRVLDVACGDDDFALDVARGVAFCVANDVQWRQLRTLFGRAMESKNIVFTNHDACRLPFRKKFDLTICKNLLHHMHSRGECDDLLASLQRVSKRLLIVDPEDPEKGRWNARLWHLYYRRWLRDQGEKFYTRDLLEALLRDRYGKTAEITCKTISTIKGNYLFADMTFKDIVEEADKRIDAVIFDLDGLLVDTEPLFIAAIRAVLSRRGLTITVADYVERDLQNGSSLLSELERKGEIADIEEIQDEIYAEYDGALRRHLSPMPGAVSVLERLQPHFRLAIASSSKHVYIKYILETLGIASYFEVIVGREDTEKLKPDPECLQLAARKLNLSVDRCVVLEDSLRGVRAAETISMRCIFIPNHLTTVADPPRTAHQLQSLDSVTLEFLMSID